MFLDYFALGILIFVVLFLFYGLIMVHDIPYEISKKRNHPHQDAIHVAGWVSLFTLHILWPFLWIWATLWRDDRGWGFQQIQKEQLDAHHRVDVLSEQVAELQRQIAELNKQLLLQQKTAQSSEHEQKIPTESSTLLQESPVIQEPQTNKGEQA